MEKTDCNLCGSGEAVPVCEPRERLLGEETFSVVRCLQCGLLYTNPRPSKGEMGKYYPPAYSAFQVTIPLRLFPAGTSARVEIKNFLRRKILALYYGYFGGSHLPDPVCALLRVLLLPLKYRVGSSFPARVEGGRALDVGCGAGQYLSWLRELGWEVQGVEADEKTARLAGEKLGLEILSGDFETIPLQENRFDVVTLWHSLEHMRDPLGTLQKVFRILREGGKVLIGIPSAVSLEARLFRSSWWGWEVPRHFYHFSPNTVSAVLKNAGFREIRIEHLPNVRNILLSLRNIVTDICPSKRRVVEKFPESERSRFLAIVLVPFGWAQALARCSGRIVVCAQK